MTGRLLDLVAVVHPSYPGATGATTTRLRGRIHRERMVLPRYGRSPRRSFTYCALSLDLDGADLVERFEGYPDEITCERCRREP